ncbi:YceI family protein [Agrobacterium tumefaciens]|uniref:Polyisoprenoid-binding protein n=3 Tax=Agrobacterium TaxID=357 RepID=A0A4D7YM78_AGRTU|nr:YceI family protein [Agrobacterium tumefaciens]KJF71712.1 polyisoprenoid-binding protein [Agrobacterium arsenijevicii]QCL96757.1 polyisoprenoid-binding protein [Agrobacterium tumefaciens]
MKFIGIGLATAMAMTFATSSRAADTYEIDPSHAWITFKIGHAGWSNAHGQFKTVSGTIVFDKTDVTKSSVQVEIAAATISTNFEQRDADLQSPDFLNASEFPTITFASTTIEKTGEKTGKLIGELTLAGVSKPVTLDVTWNSEMPLPWDKNTIKTGFSASGTFDLVDDFGMKKAAEYGLGPTVSVDIDVEAIKK